MKRIVLSRKGFDSKFGGRPSPIFKDNRIFSLPIPQRVKSPKKYKDLFFNGISGRDALREVSVKQVTDNDYCHYDPALNEHIGIFGQASSAQTELKNCYVGLGDLFLFFGWFKKFSSKGRDLHHIFGWLQISEIISGEKAIKSYLNAHNIKHPHGYGDTSRYTNNTIYIGSKKLTLGKKKTDLKGYGLFKRSVEDLILTSPQHSRSMWKLPEEYFKESVDDTKGLFINRLKWADKENFLVNTNKGPGQEFILDSKKNPGIIDWTVNLIKKYG